jgi:hypothetical protein
VAAGYLAQAKKAGKEIKPVVATPACADPGAFVYVPPVPAGAASGATPGTTAMAVTTAAKAAPATPTKK